MKAILVLCSFVVISTMAIAQPATIPVTLFPDKDNTLYGTPTGAISNGAGSHFFSGITGIGGVRRGLVHFDVASAIPAGATILQAELQLTLTMTNTGTERIALRRVMQDWGEGASNAPGGEGGGTGAQTGDATWLNTFFPTGTWTNPGGDFVPYESSAADVGLLSNVIFPSDSRTIADAQLWLDNPSLNFGWILLSTEVGTTTAKRFASKENGNVALRPRLNLVYINGPGAQAAPMWNGCPALGTALTDLEHRVWTNMPPILGSTNFQILSSGGVAGIANTSIYLAGAPAVVPTPMGGVPACAINLDIPSAQMLISQGISPIGPFVSPLGAFSLFLPLPADPSLVGQSISLQLLSFSTTQFKTSNALTLTFNF